MKHIGWCLEKIQISLAGLPKDIDSKENKEKAARVLDEVEGYAETMADLVDNRRFRRIIHRLNKSSFEEIRLEVHEIEYLQKDLMHMLYLLDLYLKELRVMLEKHSDTWAYKARQAIVAATDLLNKKKRRLGAEYTLVENIKSKLNIKLNEFTRKTEALGEEIDNRFGGDRGDLKKELKVALYTRKELKELVKNQEHLAELLKQSY